MNKETFHGDKATLYSGDSRDILKTLQDNSIDSIVCDPPYALVTSKSASAGFMGKQWDTGETAFAVTFWAEVMRVLKPGGHVIAFSGSRTYHRLAVAIEDAGFEIRDMVMWLYGSGFPKSHDVSKAIDKAAGVEFEAKPASGVGFMGPEGVNGYNVTKNQLSRSGESTLTARQWQGWGTALKPAHEPIVLARKPLSESTVAANVLRWGTGAINVDGGRVGTEGGTSKGSVPKGNGHGIYGAGLHGACDILQLDKGRFPANVLHDGSDEVVAAFPETESGKPCGMKAGNNNNVFGQFAGGIPVTGFGDSGSAARFFYSAKADSTDRIGSKHPTVKPVDLMQYLCRLVTPPGGTVLDPFAGTGSTGEAALREGFRVVLVEREEEYQADIRRRMALVYAGTEEKSREIIKAKGKADYDAGPLFG